MMPWKMVIFVLFYCNINTCVTYRRNKVKRGMASMVKPTFQNSIEDVNLLYEILLAGLQFGDERTLFSVQDEELASLRKTRKLEVICEDILPKTLSDIRRLTSDLSNHMGRLRLEDFERTVLTMVYTAQRLANATTDQQRDLWAESFVSLYRAIKLDLIG
ncbi:protein FAM180A-like [Coregonus clupeaformis]|uniref:protein FAM180A-like n=1 Tax=Coregonus clupeaformis TaxID=59861 RepID=UPI001BE0D912|nr:protein FAM180A-like [Coregonus clupeaformis]